MAKDETGDVKMTTRENGAPQPCPYAQSHFITSSEPGGQTGRVSTGDSKPKLPIADPYGPEGSPQLPAGKQMPSRQVVPAGGHGRYGCCSGCHARWLFAAAMLVLVSAAVLLSIMLASGAGSLPVKAAEVLPQNTWQVPLCGNAAAGQPSCPFPVASPLSQGTAEGAPVASAATAPAAVLVDNVSVALAIAEAAASTSAGMPPK